MQGVPENTRVEVVEVTIRDGGYEIGHDFSHESVAAIVGSLDAAGFSYIEIGHGMGFGAQRHKPEIRPKPAIMSDEDHLRIGRSVTRRAKLGVLFGCPGRLLCPIEELDKVAAFGADFVRLAVLPSDLGDEVLAYIERAKSLGLTVSLNLMQTYVVPVAAVAEYATRCVRAGLDWFYVVDSAGGMQPGEVREYVRAIIDASGARVGLHAHNNSGLALANSLAAVEAGATLVDSTLSGLGRATGNAHTEQLVLALQQLGHEAALDIDAIVRLARLVRPLLADKGNDPLDVVAGAAKVHSRNVRGLVDEAARRGISPSRFLLETGREARAQGCLDRFHLPAEILDAAAARCSTGEPAPPAPGIVEVVRRRVDPARAHTLRGVRDDLRMRASLYHKKSALHLVSAASYPFSGVLPWESCSYVGATVAWPLPDGGDAATYPLDLLVLDGDFATPPELSAVARVTTGSWREAWIDAGSTLASAAARRCGGRLWLVGDPGPEQRPIVERLARSGIEPSRARPDGPATVLVTGAPPKDELLQPGDLVIATSPTDSRAWNARAVAAGARVVMPTYATAIAVHVESMAEAEAGLAAALATNPAARFVELPQAPGAGQAIVDLRNAQIVDGQSDDETIDGVAVARAGLLVAGTGSF